MNAITFQTVVDEEQVIRPPADLRLPLGIFEITIKPVPSEATPAAVRLANESLRESRVSLGDATGIDNQGIDADLARAYGNGSTSTSPREKP